MGLSDIESGMLGVGREGYMTKWVIEEQMKKVNEIRNEFRKQLKHMTYFDLIDQIQYKFLTDLSNKKVDRESWRTINRGLSELASTLHNLTYEQH